MAARYFAYGSNLSRARLEARVGPVVAEGVAWLSDYALSWDKRGADGSGKANLQAAPEARVWGVAYRFEAARWRDLDACEPGYQRIEVEIALAGERVPAATYASPRRTDRLPFEWYKRLVVDGAREHALPPDWIAALGSQPAQPDPAD